MNCNVAKIVVAVALIAGAGINLHAQIGKSLGVVDVNTVAEKTLATFAAMTPATVKAIVAKRPFASPVELNTFLLAQGLTQKQADAFYEKAFVHINLNTATAAEILLVPRAGKKMAHEFDEYRPWKTWAQFDKEIGKYVGADATARLGQFAFIPMNANTASDDALMTIPGATAALVSKIMKGRPYKVIADVEQALAKGATSAEGKRVARYLVVIP